MSLKNYDISARKDGEPIDHDNPEWHVRVRAESPADAVELGNKIFRLALPDLDPDDYFVHASGPQ